MGDAFVRRSFGAMSPLKIVLVVVSLLIYAAVLAALAFYFFIDQEPEPEPVFGSLDGRFESAITMQHGEALLHYRENEITNYLIIGLDQTDVAKANSHQRGGQADFLVVLSIDRIRRTVTPLMLDRDTMTDIQTYGVFGHPAGTQQMQLCLAQAYSGISTPGSANTAQAVSKLLHGVIIDHYVTLDMTAIPLVNDAIGGVEITLPDDFTVYDPQMTKGKTIRLMGEQAEFFVRGRMTIADGTNQSRMARQQQYLSAFLSQFRQEVSGSQKRLSELLDTVSGHMTSDASENVLLHDINNYDHYAWQPLRTLEGTHRIDEYGFAEFWPDENKLRDCVAGIWFQ